MKGFKEMMLAILFGAVLPCMLLRAVDVPEQHSSEQLVISILSDNGVESMEINDYLTGVLLAEMSPVFHPEALKAQAVAARTFALHGKTFASKHVGADVCTAANCCQGYISPEEYVLNGGKSETVLKMQEAVEATGSKVLYYNGDLIEATYFSASGGRTEDAEEVWGSSVPYLQSVESAEGDSYFETVMAKDLFCEKLGLSKGDVHFDKPTYTSGGGVESIRINGTSFTGTQLRQRLRLRSTNISFSVHQDEIHIITNGYGHRVGMSQYGADAMAEKGSDYREILKHYYMGVTVGNYAGEKN